MILLAGVTTLGVELAYWTRFEIQTHALLPFMQPPGPASIIAEYGIAAARKTAFIVLLSLLVLLPLRRWLQPWIAFGAAPLLLGAWNAGLEVWRLQSDRVLGPDYADRMVLLVMQLALMQAVMAAGAVALWQWRERRKAAVKQAQAFD